MYFVNVLVFARDCCSLAFSLSNCLLLYELIFLEYLPLQLLSCFYASLSPQGAFSQSTRLSLRNLISSSSFFHRLTCFFFEYLLALVQAYFLKVLFCYQYSPISMQAYFLKLVFRRLDFLLRLLTASMQAYFLEVLFWFDYLLEERAQFPNVAKAGHKDYLFR